jgi:hypothetical protein
VTTMVITTTWPLRLTPCCSRRCFLGASDFTIGSAEDLQGGFLGTVLRCLAVMPCAAGLSACKPIDDYWLKLMEPVIEKQLWEKSV